MLSCRQVSYPLAGPGQFRSPGRATAGRAALPQLRLPGPACRRVAPMPCQVGGGVEEGAWGAGRPTRRELVGAVEGAPLTRHSPTSGPSDPHPLTPLMMQSRQGGCAALGQRARTQRGIDPAYRKVNY